MIGLVVAAHGRLAEEMVATAEAIVGTLTSVVTCSVEPGVSTEEFKARMRGCITQVDQGEGVIVLADLLGGTPCTQGLSLCAGARVEVLTGFNLPMLLKANALRAENPTLATLAQQLMQYGQKNITCASEALRAQTRSTAA
jgi:PTS system mannose-specific IIA component